MSERVKKDSNKWAQAVIFFVVIFISLPIMLFFNNWYYSFQVLKLSNNSTLLFIHDDISRWIMCFSPPIIVFLVILIIKNKCNIKLVEVKSYLVIAIMIFIISISFLYFKFFDYTDINKEGIHVSDGIFLNNKDYKWSDVTEAKVSYKRGNKNAIIISYDIYLNDGKIVHAYDSKEFFNNIINLDNLMQSEEIKINRQKIQSSDYNDFIRQYNGPGAQKLIGGKLFK